MNRQRTTVNNETTNFLRDQIVRLIDREDGQWAGTASQLRDRLVRQLRDEEREQLPSSPAHLRLALNRALAKIRNRGISVDFYRHGTRSDKFIEFTKRSTRNS